MLIVLASFLIPKVAGMGLVTHKISWPTLHIFPRPRILALIGAWSVLRIGLRYLISKYLRTLTPFLTSQSSPQGPTIYFQVTQLNSELLRAHQEGLRHFYQPCFLIFCNFGALTSPGLADSVRNAPSKVVNS